MGGINMNMKLEVANSIIDLLWIRGLINDLERERIKLKNAETFTL